MYDSGKRILHLLTNKIDLSLSTLNSYLEIKETERLLIRPLTKEDSLIWTEFIMDEKATRYFPDNMKMSPDKAELWINGQLKRYRENKFGLMALVDKSSLNLVGQCGLLEQVIDGRKEIEIGYHLMPERWGKGFATEAAGKFKALVFENKLAESVISIIHPDNILSRKVAERNGMTLTSKCVYRGQAACIYRVAKEHMLTIR